MCKSCKRRNKVKFEQKEIAKFNDLVKNAGNYSLYKKWTKKEKKTSS